MLLRTAFVLSVVLATVVTAPAFADTSKTSRYMRVFGTAAPPYGFVQFCQSFGEECRTYTDGGSRFEATPARLAELDLVNRNVNRAVKPATDQEIFGVTEFWTIPGARGDCEDYAILKRRMLMERGWPASSLLLTVVRDEVGDGHAVLTVRTAQGDYILDNKVDEVHLWSHTPYKYVMRQSYLNTKVWMALDPRVQETLGSIAGLQ